MTGEKVHFVGVAGNGMSALAQFHVMGGGAATGSDRLFDQGGAAELRHKLESVGIRVLPQDGSALKGKPSCVVASTAVEEGNADLVRARAAGIPIIHRADWLAQYVNASRAIAVAGTSGKSTVAAMIFEILEAAGLSPSIITGGPLVSLEKKGLIGNAFRGKGDLLVAEADESDGTLVKYRPWLGVLLNVSKDHKEMDELKSLFRDFRGHCREFVVQAQSLGLEEFQKDGLMFGIDAGIIRAEKLELGPQESKFVISNVPFTLPLAGRYNVENVVAAVAACSRVGVDIRSAAKALARYEGVARRMQCIGIVRGVEVIDDFAHNPAKITAVLEAVHLRAKRVHVVFQLHGFAPANFLRQEFVAAFIQSLKPGDTLWMPEIYYVGGTASKTISARDIVQDIAKEHAATHFLENREAIAAEVATIARSGDVILVLGARDPSLPEFARNILSVLALKQERKIET